MKARAILLNTDALDAEITTTMPVKQWKVVRSKLNEGRFDKTLDDYVNHISKTIDKIEETLTPDMEVE